MNRLNDTMEDPIIDVLQRTGPCCLDDLVVQLPNHDWSEIFATVDRMSRDGRLVLRRFPRSGYQLSLPLVHAAGKEVYA
ncbi:MAG: hypothetical protein Q8N04_07725 [Nitrospira sp.]|nr:hypothetical protein [Nitrospira sp.]